LERKKQKVEEVLGTKITEEESENPTMLVAKYLIEDLSKRTLTDEQKQTLEEAKKYFESGNYEKVLILLFPIGQ
jgi:tetrahydromethanopterin S-methyltransferase subunit H